MKILIPTIKKINIQDTAKHLEYVGRVCYNSFNKTTEESAIPFLKKLAKAEHYGIFEHAAVDVREAMPELDLLQENSPEFGLVMARVVLGGLRYSDLLKYSSKYKNNIEAAVKDLPRFQHLLTFEVTCSRAISHQWVRHRNQAYAERSLRRFKFDTLEDFELVPPCGIHPSKALTLISESAADSFNKYRELLESGSTPDEARSVLPMCTATKLIVTADMSWFLEFLRLRYAPQASIEMQYLARQLYTWMPEEVKETAVKIDLVKQFETVDKNLTKDGRYA